MRIVQVKVYHFDELSKAAKKIALDSHRDVQVESEDWADLIVGDASDIGLKISSFDTYEDEIEGELTQDIRKCIELIKKNHGHNCATYKIAIETETKLSDSNLSLKELQSIESEFLDNLLREYLDMLNNHLNYLTSDEGLAEYFDAKWYEFTEDGKRFKF